MKEKDKPSDGIIFPEEGRRNLTMEEKTTFQIIFKGRNLTVEEKTFQS